MGFNQHILAGIGGGSGFTTQNIASAMRVMGFNTASQSNGTDTAFNSVKNVVNDSGVSVSQIQLVFQGWRMETDGNGAEANNNGNLNITASFEYPVGGTRYQCTFSGSTTGVVLPGALLVSDPIVISGGYASGANAALHTYGTCLSGVKWPLCACADGFGGSVADLSESGASGTLPDRTMSGNPTGTTQPYFPCLLLGTGKGFRKVCLATFGDSITVGAGDTHYDSHNNTSWIGRAATNLCPIVHGAVTGTNASAQIGNFAKRVALCQLAGVTHVSLNYGSNDLLSRTLAQLQSDTQTIAGYFSAVGIKPLGYTIVPRLATTTGADYQYTPAQTLAGQGFTAGTSSTRHQFNQWIRTTPSPLFDFIETSNPCDVDVTNTLVSGGGYQATGKATNQDTFYTGAIVAGSTTTVIATNIIKAANYWGFVGGAVRFTSGTLNGTVAPMASFPTNDTSGNIDLASALSTLPSVGDTILVTSFLTGFSNDGTHPSIASNNGLATLFGGELYMIPPAIAKITALNT